jgi:hypothetical protein
MHSEPVTGLVGIMNDATLGLLGRLASVEQRAITDLAWWQLLRELESRLDGIPRPGCSCQHHATDAVPAQSAAVATWSPDAAVATTAAATPTVADDGRTLAHHPLASTLLGFLPYEYQTLAWNLISSVRITRRTMLAAGAIALAAGWYTGRVSIPPALTSAITTAYLSACPVPPPQPQPQSQAIDPATGLPTPATP